MQLKSFFSKFKSDIFSGFILLFILYGLLYIIAYGIALPNPDLYTMGKNVESDVLASPVPHALAAPQANFLAVILRPLFDGTADFEMQLFFFSFLLAPILLIIGEIISIKAGLPGIIKKKSDWKIIIGAAFILVSLIGLYLLYLYYSEDYNYYLTMQNVISLLIMKLITLEIIISLLLSSLLYFVIRKLKILELKTVKLIVIILSSLTYISIFLIDKITYISFLAVFSIIIALIVRLFIAHQFLKNGLIVSILFALMINLFISLFINPLLN